MNILIVGLTYTGSSAVVDLLKEYSNIGCIPGEFYEFKRAQMIGDHLLGRIGGEYPNSGISRWISSKRDPDLYRYIDLKLDYKKDKTLTSEDKARFTALIDLEKQMNETQDLEHRMVYAKKYIKQIRSIYAKNKEHVIFDQALFFGVCEDIWQEFFKPFKLIIVTRDIKDKIADLIRLKYLFFDRETCSRSNILKYGDGKLGAINYEVDIQLRKEQYILELHKNNPNDILIIKFEDLILKHLETKKEIEAFLNISPEKHTNADKHLKINISKENIGLYNKYLNKNEIQLIDNLIKQQQQP